MVYILKRRVLLVFLIFLSNANFSLRPAIAQSSHGVKYAEIKGEFFTPDNDTLKQTAESLAKEKPGFGVLVFQAEINEIQCRTAAGISPAEKDSGKFDENKGVWWYRVPRSFKTFTFKTPHSSHITVKAPFSDSMQVFYYKITPVEPGFKMAFIPRSSKWADTTRHGLQQSEIKGFFMSLTEITNAQFCDFMNDTSNGNKIDPNWLEVKSEHCLTVNNNGHYLPKPNCENHPVVEVSWHGAKAFCDWLTEKERRVSSAYRLPTEDEWEYGALGNGQFAASDTATHEYGNFRLRNGFDRWPRTAPVGRFKANAFDVYDMLGNVWEWCAGPIMERTLDAKEKRVVRGGSWLFSPRDIYLSSRAQLDPGFCSYAVGFRVVLSCKE